MLCRRDGIARPQVPDLVQAVRGVARHFGRDWRTRGSCLPVRADERLKLAARDFSSGRGVGPELLAACGGAAISGGFQGTERQGTAVQRYETCASFSDVGSKLCRRVPGYNFGLKPREQEPRLCQPKCHLAVTALYKSPRRA